MEDKLMTTSEAAEYLGIAQSTLRTYMQKGVLVPVGRLQESRGKPSLFKLTDLENLKNSSVFVNPTQYTSRGKTAYRINKNGWPSEDEVHPSGCIIHWSEVIWGGYARVPITCASCGNRHIKYISHLKESVKRGQFTGCCSNCYQANRKLPKLKSNGYIIWRDGYIYRHKRTFTEQEWQILSKMNPSNGIYIIDNLEILVLSDHSQYHIEQLRREADLIKQVKTLTAEIERLRSLLSQYEREY